MRARGVALFLVVLSFARPCEPIDASGQIRPLLPWKMSKYVAPAQRPTDIWEPGCWAGMSEEQDRLFRTFVAARNVERQAPLEMEEVWARLDEWERATFLSITYAMEHTDLTGEQYFGSVSGQIEEITEIRGKDLKDPEHNGDKQFRLYGRLREGAYLSFEKSNQFGPPGKNVWAHKGYPFSFRQKGDVPKLQISTDVMHQNADIDIDYRRWNIFLNEGHTHPSNSDVTSDRGGIDNYERYRRRWPGWRGCEVSEDERDRDEKVGHQGDSLGLGLWYGQPVPRNRANKTTGKTNTHSWSKAIYGNVVIAGRF